MIRDNSLAIAALAIGVLILVALVVLINLVRELIIEVRDNTVETIRNGTQMGDVEVAIDNLRLKSRTRVSKLATRTGMPDETVGLHRLGRTTAAKRVVVGGEQGSAQREGLERTVSKNRDEED